MPNPGSSSRSSSRAMSSRTACCARRWWASPSSSGSLRLSRAEGEKRVVNVERGRAGHARSHPLHVGVADDLRLLLQPVLLEAAADQRQIVVARSEEHTPELQSLMRISYAVFCLKKKNHNPHI